MSTPTTFRICMPFVGDSVGGSHVSALLLARHLTPPFQPVVLLHEQGPLSEYVAACGIEHRFLPLTAYVGGSRGVPLQFAAAVAAAVPIIRFLSQNRISIVHCNDGRMNQTWVGPARLSGVPFLWHQRSVYAESRLTRLALRGATAIVCNSPHVARGMPREFSDRIHAIDNPFETDVPVAAREVSRRGLLAELGCAEDATIVGFVGNLTAQKRVELFLDCAAELAVRDGRTWVFPIFGRDRDGRQETLEQRSMGLGIGASVRFLGFRSSIEQWLAGCDVMVATGLDDAFGRTLVEAMLAGTPVVASRSGGHVDILENDVTGLFPIRDDAGGFADQVLRLLTDRHLATRLSTAARSEARRRYSIASHVAGIQSIYSKLLGDDASGAEAVATR